jgi:hypothetical protein
MEADLRKELLQGKLNLFFAGKGAPILKDVRAG